MKDLSEQLKESLSGISQNFQKIQKSDFGNKAVSVTYSACAITASFYALTIACQRLVGSIALHGGHPLVMNTPIGFLSTAGCCAVSLNFQEKVIPLLKNPSDSLTNVCISHDSFLADATNKALPGSILFSILERKSFLTAFPSSILELGVYAPRKDIQSSSVLATGSVATSKQRQTIQTLGRKYGCHQCGSFNPGKELGKLSTFIADHQPPTKYAEIKRNSAKFWQKIFSKNGKIEVSCYDSFFLYY